MSIAKTTEITATSSTSFEDAVKEGIARAAKTLDNVKAAWVKDQEVKVDNGTITEYKATLKITFVLQD